MTHEEFEAKLGSKVSDADYTIIERVYAFHPVISNTKGKQQIADLYKIGGMRVIKDMVATADAAEVIDQQIFSCRVAIREQEDNLRQLLENLDLLRR